MTKKVSLTTPKTAKGAITVKWKKPSADVLGVISGYQIQYSLKKNFKGAKTVKVGKTATSKKLTKLKKKTNYYIRVRTYTPTQTGPWSAVKKIKTK